MALAAGVALLLDHAFALLALDHVHDEASALDFGFVEGTCLLVHSQDGLSHFLLVLEFLQLCLDYAPIVRVKFGSAYLLRSFGIRFGSARAPASVL